MIGIEDAGEQGLQRYERQIGKRDARESDGEIEALWIVEEARRQETDHLGREQQRYRQQHHVDGDESGGDLIGEQLGGRQTRFLQRARIGRHKGSGEGTLGEDGPEMVWQTESDEERIGDGPGAEDRGHDHIPDKAREARDEREPADGGDAPNHVSWIAPNIRPVVLA